MGDSYGYSKAFLQQLQKSRKNEEYAREQLLIRNHLTLDEGSLPWILNHIDCLVSQSRGNRTVKTVHLHPYAFIGHDHGDEVWEKLALAIRSLEVVEWFRISTYGKPRRRTHDFHEEVAVPIPNWDRLACIISNTQQKIELHYCPPWDVEEVQALCRAIRGHPAITSFRSSSIMPYESMDLLYSVLATLPALESVRLSNSERQARPEDESTTTAHHESLTELLRRPSLRWVRFDPVSFTPELCQAIANALMEGTSVTKLDFISCSFPEKECAVMMANGLSRNTSVSDIHVESPIDQTLYSALVTALPSNSTLHNISFSVSLCPGLSSVVSALRKNMGLKTLEVHCTTSRNHVFPPFGSTLWPCCKRTRHLRVLSSEARMQSESRPRSISYSIPRSNTIRRARLSN
jgi:hypothetical protein